jgi:hypothetical protein
VDFYSLSRQTYPYIIYFFLHMYNYVVIDSRYREASSLVEDSIQEMLENLLQAQIDIHGN